MVAQFTSRQLISNAIAKRIEAILSDKDHVGRFGILSTSATRFDPIELIGLLEVVTHDEFSELHSALAVAEYASQFLAYSKDDRLDAVKNLLPQLGLLRDPDLFSSGTLNESIKRNIEYTRKIRHFSKADYT